MRLQAFLLAAASVVATAAEAADVPAGSAERGGKIYIQQMCYTCHGTVGQGGERAAGPKIAPNPFPYAAFTVQVRTPRQLMPPYTAKNLPDQDLADIYAYLLAVRAPQAAKDIPLLNQ